MDFFTLKVDKNRHFLTSCPPHLVHVVFERSHKLCRRRFKFNVNKMGQKLKGDFRDLAMAFKLTLFVLHTLANYVHTTTAGRSNAGKLFLKQYFHSIATVVTSHEIKKNQIDQLIKLEKCM